MNKPWKSHGQSEMGDPINKWTLIPKLPIRKYKQRSGICGRCVKILNRSPIDSSQRHAKRIFYPSDSCQWAEKRILGASDSCQWAEKHVLDASDCCQRAEKRVLDAAANRK